ncbi:hypothetical protein ACFLT2_03100 [Acidobacteriota bacterium]
MREERIQRAIVFGMMCSLFFGSARAQEAKWFNLAELAGALILEYEITDEKLDSAGVTAYDNYRKLLQGGIQLDTVGSIYHPNLLTFRAKVNLIGLNTHRQSFTDTSVNNDLNNSYDINLAFLKKKVLSLELFTLRNFSTADRAFLERYFVVTESAGFVVQSRTKFLPFRLEVYKRDMVSQSEVFLERDEKTKNVDFKSQLIDASRSKSSLLVRWKDYYEARYDIDYESLDAMTNFIHSYGPKQRNRLLSLLSFNRLTGDYNIQRFQFVTNALQYVQSPLFLNGIYTFNWEEMFDRSARRHRLSGSINHKLYESLTSAFELGGRFEDSTFQNIRGYHYQLSSNYSKRIPTGRIQLFYLARRENNDFSSRNGIINTSEAFDFSLSDTFILSRPGTDVDSIRITDVDLTYVFLKDVDYQVDIVNNTVVILRLPGGAIQRGMKLLVHYDYLSYPDHRLETRVDQLFFQLTFLKYFQTYYTQGSNKNTAISDFVIPPYESYTRRQIGIKFDARVLSMEYSREKRDSTLTDYNAWNFRASAGLRLFRTLNLSGYLLWNNLEYEPKVFTSDYHARSLECSFNPRNNLTAAFIYRKILYSTNTYSRMREGIVFKVQWQIRKIIINVFYEHIFNRAESTLRLRNFFSIMIRRTF